MLDKEAEELLLKYREGRCSEAEKVLLESWYNQYGAVPQVPLTDEQWATDVQQILYLLDNKDRPSPKIGRWWMAAASVAAVLILALAIWWRGVFPTQQHPTLTPQAQAIVPGGNKAVLTLGDGSRIVLDNAKNGTLTVQQGATVSKSEDGLLKYGSSSPTTAGLMNTISTPAGGQYQVILSDGSHVWLNAASTIVYPVAFNGDKRVVTLSGEAYFEIAPDAHKPFVVKSPRQSVEVLGTHFNVNAYDDEPTIKTTLSEGRIRINGATLLKPGEQSLLTGSGIQVKSVDTEVALAWKNNKFMFEKDDIQTIMRMISRWYNVDVRYSGPITSEKFGGSVSRFADVGAVLRILELTGNVHFTVNGKVITVTN